MTLVVLLVAVAGFLYMVAASLDPSLGPGNAGAQSVAKAAVKHLSANPSVESARVQHAGADSNAGSFAEVEAHLKADTPVDSAAGMLPATCRAAQKKSIWGTVSVGVTFTWSMKGTDIDVYFGCRDSDSDLRTSVQRALSPAGQAATIKRDGETSPLRVDYGQVTTIPTTLAQPGVKNSSKTFTMNGWEVTSTSNKEGEFPTTDFEQVITAARRAGPTGTIDLDGGTLSVTGLVTDERTGLTPEAAAPVVHTVADCRAAGLTTLQLNGKLQKGLSSDDEYWLTFTCQDGAWAPHHGGNTGKDEAAIVQKAAEL